MNTLATNVGHLPLCKETFKYDYRCYLWPDLKGNTLERMIGRM